MRAEIEKPELLLDQTNGGATRRLRVVIADASPGFMSVVLSMLEFHEVVDLIGRAATFDEVVQLVLNQQPDMVLIDLAMPLANLTIPAIILASRSPIKIIGMCEDGTVSLAPLEILTTVGALIRKERLGDEFLTVLQALFRSTAAFSSTSSPPEPEQATNQWWSGLSRQAIH